MVTRRRKALVRWRSSAAQRLLELAGDGCRSVEDAIPLVVSRLFEGVRRTPADLQGIAPKVDIISIEPDPDLTIAGELRRTREGLKIVYDSSSPRGMRRFTIAHEIGHAILKSRRGVNCFGRGRELERLCDLIAAEILLPAREIKDRLTDACPSIRQLLELASEFDASLMATARRAAEFRHLAVFSLDENSVVWRTGLRLRTPPPEASKFVAMVLEGRCVDGTILSSARGTTERWRVTGMPNGAGALLLFELRPL